MHSVTTHKMWWCTHLYIMCMIFDEFLFVCLFVFQHGRFSIWASHTASSFSIFRGKPDDTNGRYHHWFGRYVRVCVCTHMCVCVFVRREWGEHFNHYRVILTLWYECFLNVSSTVCYNILICMLRMCSCRNSSSISVLIVCTAFSHKKAHFQDLKKSCCPFLCYGTTRRGKVTYKTLNVTKRKVLLKNKRKKITT